MRIAKHLALAGAGALALAVGTGLALAQPLHSMTVRLPDGGIAQIRYSGNIPPRVAFMPGPPASAYMRSAYARPAYYRAASPFATLDRISAQMDREMDALMSEVAMTPPLANPQAMFNVDMRNLPPGALQYSAVSTVAGGGNFCTRSIEITRGASGARPRIVERTSGDCRGVGNMRLGAAPLPPQQHAARRIETRNWRASRRSGPEILNVAYQPTR